MIALSRPFTLRHPWWSVVFLTLLGMLFILLALLPVWGWVEMRFSPVQRFYLPVYLQSTIGVLQGSGPEYVKWIEKRAPGKAWEIADPGDLVPVKEGTAPFELSKPALSQGWTDLRYAEGGTFQQQETRDFLETDFFGGHSFLFLVLQPFELVLVGWMCWKLFDNWRNNLAWERGSAWDPNYRPMPGDEDLALFTKLFYQEARKGAIRSWKWIALKRQSDQQPALVTAVPVSVSMSKVVKPGPPRPNPPNPNVPASAVAKPIEITPVRSSKPAPSLAKPSLPFAQKVRSTRVEPEPKTAAKSPFGRSATEGQPERQWDISQWID